MLRTSYFKKFLLGGSAYAATAIKAGEGQDAGGQGGAVSGPGKGKGTSDQDTDGSEQGKGDNCDPCTGKLIRRTDLPLYSDGSSETDPPCDGTPSSLEKGISAVRKELWVWHDQYDGYREKVKKVVVTGKEHTAVLIERLREDELPIPRSGAIAISGLAGIILGLRGGWFKRLFYGSTCAGLMAAVCYPKEVAGISEETLETTKKYVLITYNFIYGVKPESLKLPSPSQLLGNPVARPDKEKGDTKISVPAVSEEKSDTSVRKIKSHIHCNIPDSPENFETEPEHEPTTPEDAAPSCLCPTHVNPDHNSNEQAHENGGPGPSFTFAFHSRFDRVAEESADVVYWGFRLS